METLPPELISELCRSHLCIESILALAQCSARLYQTTQHPYLWYEKLRRIRGNVYARKDYCLDYNWKKECSWVFGKVLWQHWRPELKEPYMGHGWCVKMDEDRDMIIVGHEEGMTLYQSSQPLSILHQIPLDDEISCMKYNYPSIYYGTSKGTLHEYDLDKQNIKNTLVHSSSHSICTLMPWKYNLHLIITGSGDNTIHLHDWRTKTTAANLTSPTSQHDGTVLCLEQLDEHTLASGGRDRTLRIFDIRQMQMRQVMFAGQAVRSLLDLGNRKLILGGGHGAKGMLQVWDVEKTLCIDRLDQTQGAHMTAITGLALSRQLNHFVTCSWDGTVRLWDKENVDIGSSSLVASSFHGIHRLHFPSKSNILQAHEETNIILPNWNLLEPESVSTSEEWKFMQRLFLT